MSGELTYLLRRIGVAGYNALLSSGEGSAVHLALSRDRRAVNEPQCSRLLGDSHPRWSNAAVTEASSADLAIGAEWIPLQSL